MRNNGRHAKELRAIKITSNYLKYPEGSCLVEFGNTKVICTATVDTKVPQFLKSSGQGWVTAEYGMLPRSAPTRIQRENGHYRSHGRTQEIQRLIGRSLRAVTNLQNLGERTIWIDCDVIQADGGTRSASITGSFVCLCQVARLLVDKKVCSVFPIKNTLAAVSVGRVNGENILDLDYEEDSNAEVDLNIVMTGDGRFVEIQGTAEGEPFSKENLDGLISLAASGIDHIINVQKASMDFDLSLYFRY